MRKLLMRPMAVTAKAYWEMSQEEWNAATRFYYSGKTKNIQTPAGTRAILVDDATPNTFRVSSAAFLRRVRRNDLAKALSEGKSVPAEVLREFSPLM